MKYVAHEIWLRQNPSPYTEDLIALINEARSQPAFNTVEYNNDRIHQEIASRVTEATRGYKCQFLFNKSLHGVAGFGFENGPYLINHHLREIPVFEYEATDGGLESILREIKLKNYHAAI